MPNSEAIALHGQVEKLYSGVSKLNTFMSDLAQNRHGEVQIAAMPLIAHRWLPKVVAPLLRRHREVSASFPVRSSNWVGKWVAAGRADLGIAMPVSTEGVIVEPLMALPMVAVMAEDHPLAMGAQLSAADLAGESLITLSTFDYSPTFFDDLLGPTLVAAGRRIQTFTTYVACELARQGLGVALVDALTAMSFRDEGKGLKIRALVEQPVIDIAMLSSASWPRSALSTQFMEEIRQQAALSMAQVVELVRKCEGPA